MISLKILKISLKDENFKSIFDDFEIVYHNSWINLSIFYHNYDYIIFHNLKEWYIVVRLFLCRNILVCGVGILVF